jgi:hypothetical protein
LPDTTGQVKVGVFLKMMRWLWRDQPVSTDPNDRVERSFRGPAAAPPPPSLQSANQESSTAPSLRQ